MRPEDMIRRYAFDDVAGIYLQHHGIIGQKWGIRRFQNPDGSLTPAGRERYRKNISRMDEITSKEAEWNELVNTRGMNYANKVFGKEIKEYYKLAKDARKLSGAKTDDEFRAKLAEERAKMADEKTLKDAGISTETYGTKNQWQMCTLKGKSGDGDFEVNTERAKGETTDNLIERIRKASDTISKNNDKIKRYGEKIYNEIAEDWWDEEWRGTKVPSKEEFVKGLKLRGVMATDDGKTYFVRYEDTSEIFGGHYVSFELDKNLKYLRDELEG